MDPYVLSVPAINLQFAGKDREKFLISFREAGVQRVFLVLGANSLISGDREKELAALKENAAVLKAAGYEAGAWLWAFYLSEKHSFTRMRGADGTVSKFSVCPTDKAYRAAMGKYIGEIAAAGVALTYELAYQDEDGSFRPADTMTREELAQVIYAIFAE